MGGDPGEIDDAAFDVELVLLHPRIAWGLVVARRRHGRPTPPLLAAAVVLRLALPALFVAGVLTAMVLSR